MMFTICCTTRYERCRKPVYPIMPSVINVKREIADFTAKGNAIFPDEVLFGRALCKVSDTPPPAEDETGSAAIADVKVIRSVIDRCRQRLPPARQGDCAA
ncbi:MAG: hypothetical protein MZV63_05670 [Marinilabiliales bacterium]|nr:hypothetical protein [Marinilabiliales bacterium]